MKYKDYVAKVDYDEEADRLHGEVVNIRDAITFQGRSIDELHQAFKDSVEDYLAYCAELGEKPDKPFSGRFVLRTSPDLHRELYVEAKKEGVSLNQWINQRLSSFLHA
ncbi:MAG: type II toxin-antitoxin system HicB family antitoxin [Thiotrichaceae bacterium]|nr:type II toxin-antitoxin system HicB family antitoxin [Thiotrichaceae bacterium]